MAITAPKIKVVTPTAGIPLSRGFYQLEEDELYLPLEYPGEKARFFSYLDSGQVCLHLDREGRLIFVEVTTPRRQWKERDHFVFPEIAAPADIRFLDFRDSLVPPSVYCDHRRNRILIRFMRGSAEHNYHLGQNLIGQVDKQDRLIALWAGDIIDDLAGREIAAWRKTVHGVSSPVTSPARLK